MLKMIFKMLKIKKLKQNMKKIIIKIIKMTNIWDVFLYLMNIFFLHCELATITEKMIFTDYAK